MDETVIESDAHLALHTASTVKNRWHNGTAPNLAEVLKRNPELKNHRTIIIEMAYAEFRRRLESGESIDADEFSRRFPSFERSIQFYILAQSLVENDPDFVALRSTLSWPDVGDSFLGFDLISELGRGAVGRIYLASENALGERRVVIKVSQQGGFEADILGRIQHANIVPIHSIKEDAATGLTAFCMPFLGRATLASVVDVLYASRQPPDRAQAILDAIGTANLGIDLPESPPPDRILRRGSYEEGVIHVALQLVEALSHSHAHGIYHRDLKPSNILMSPDGRPLLLDFNLSADERRPTWGVGGTLPYMAPEELYALCHLSTYGHLQSYDPRSDLFSLGVILYELSTGTLPFGPLPFNSPLEEVAILLRHRHAAGPRPIRELNPRVGKRLARLIGACLAFDPALRWNDADELATALRSELKLARRTGRWLANHRRLVFMAAMAAFTVLLATTAYFVFRPPYSIRQFRQGLAYYEAGKDDLALESLNASLQTTPGSIEALTTRAGVYQHRGDFQLAFADYVAAGRLKPSPWIDACKGYCSNRLAQHEFATRFYLLSLNGGYESAVVLNNLGYSWLQLHKLDDAEAFLHRAIQADNGLQAAHYNLALVYLRRAYGGKAIPSEAFMHARRAMETGPASGKMCSDLARLYAFGAKQDSALAQSAIGYIAKAVEFGIDAKSIESDPVFEHLKEDPAFQTALVARVVAQKSAATPQVIDPSSERRSKQFDGPTLKADRKN